MPYIDFQYSLHIYKQTKFTIIIMSSCVICCESYSNANRSKHKKIVCMYCQFSACSECCQTYMISNQTSRCMNPETNSEGELICGKEWSRKFMVEQFPKVFMNKQWKEVLEQIGYDSEKALLPATQSIVEERIYKEKIIKEIREVDKLIRELQTRRRNLEEEHQFGYNQTENREKNFIRACPDEDCRGYLSSVWKCGLCSKWTCPDCHIIKGITQDTAHTCNPDDVETAKLLKKDTKPCPKCSTGIFKIDGCDQMWCTQCHTAFSWRTGRIETHIHNPHFYEWQRRQNNGEAPRVVGDFVCGRELDHRSSGSIYRYLLRLTADVTIKNKRTYTFAITNLQKNIDYIIQSCLHIMYVQMVPYRVAHEQDNVELRIQFLRNQIDENTFKTLVQRANKKHAKTKEIGNILHLLIQTVTDCIYRAVEFLNISRNQTTEEGALKLFADLSTIAIDEPNAILNYCNECLEDIAKTYGSKRKMLKWFNEERSVRNVNRDVLVPYHNRK